MAARKQTALSPGRAGIGEDAVLCSGAALKSRKWSSSYTSVEFSDVFLLPRYECMIR